MASGHIIFSNASCFRHVPLVIENLYDSVRQIKKKIELLTLFDYFFFYSGGLKAVIYTDTLQTVIMVAGAIVLMVLGKQILNNIS